MHRRRLNAGTGDSEMLVDTSYDEWRKIIATNLDGTFVCMRQAAKHMVKTGNGGRLIAVTSVHEHQPRAGSGPYDAANGIGGLIKTFALELGQHNITANAVAPRRCSRNRRCDCISCEPSGRLRDGCVVGRRRGLAADGAAGWRI
jgi:NAD(P)-dependent dehydrogenase (short-subunit alcohol dehydrogenase family)